jgi:hypothetical protein
VGLCSAVLPLIRLRRAIDPYRFESTLDKLRIKIEVSIPDSEKFLGADLVGGRSGALAVCVLAWEQTADRRWLEVAGKLYHTLIESSQLHGDIRYFPSAPGVSEHPFGSLSGLSHGQAGIAYALSLYYRVCPEHYSDTANIILQTFRFEADNYDPGLRGWRDYRTYLPYHSSFNFSWAYGIPGVMLAARAIGSDEIYLEIQEFASRLPFQSFVREALSKQIDDNDDSLSSGVLGTLAIAHRILPTDQFRDLEDTARHSTLFVRSPPDMLPGLMTGMTGRYLGAICFDGYDWLDIPLLPHEFCRPLGPYSHAVR